MSLDPKEFWKREVLETLMIRNLVSDSIWDRVWIRKRVGSRIAPRWSSAKVKQRRAGQERVTQTLW